MASFDLITKGPANLNGLSPQAAPNGLMLDQQNNFLTSVGSAGKESLPSQRLLTLLTQAPLTAITTAQNLFTQNLNSFLMNRVNRSMRIRGRGIYTSPGTTTPIITIAILLGATTMVSVSTAALSATATTNGQFSFEFYLTTTAGGAGGAMEAHGEVDMNISAGTLGAALSQFLDQNTGVVSVNVASALTLSAQISANSVITSAKLINATIDLQGV